MHIMYTRRQIHTDDTHTRVHTYIYTIIYIHTQIAHSHSRSHEYTHTHTQTQNLYVATIYWKMASNISWFSSSDISSEPLSITFTR
jgi:hypothetical protein